MTNPLVFASVFFALLGLVFLLITIKVLRMRKILTTALYFVTALLMLSLSALFATIGVAIQGYTALTREEPAAIVKIEPTGEQMFAARVTLPGNGGERTFSLAGDQLYIDAHILKWKPLANFLGLHTSYELDRISGRYANLDDERTKVRTVYPLSKDKTLDMFELRNRFAVLNPLLDTEYGSATFIQSNSAEEFRVMVSTTGLLIRKTEKTSSQ